jgi:serine phosphatase RsbU (regulator of sigma subunit)
MTAFFAASALLLAILGVYGVVSYTVRQRISEMGTRMALGAAPRDLLRLVLSEGLRMAAIGSVIGLLLVLASAHTLNTSDLHVEFGGPLPFLVTLVLIAACTLLASWFPAWRATNLPPMVAIRSDLHLNWHRVRFNYRLLTERISEAIPHSVVTARPGNQLLAAIAETSRRAESFSEAIELGLATLCEQLGASSSYFFTRRENDQPFRLTTACPVADHAEHTLPAGSVLINRLLNYSSALPLPSDDLAALRKWAAEFAPDHIAELDTLIALEARMAVPVLSKSEMIGLLLLGERRGDLAYTAQDRMTLRSAAAQFALMLENSRLTDRIVEQERLRRELLMAAEVQKRLFPEKSPETAAIQLAGLCLPARGVGGDYYDFLELGNHQIGIALADVAGKGIAAALIMSIVQASLRSLAGSNGSSLGDLAAKMNRLLHRSTGTSSYATFFYAQFDEDKRRLRYVNAGHNPPMLLRAVGGLAASEPATIEELSAGGTIIGMFAQSRYEESSVDLKSGDVLIAFSDGVTEAHNPADDEFGEDRLKDVLRRSAHLPISEMSSHILQELKTWMADAPQFDDLTFIVMKVA